MIKYSTAFLLAVLLSANNSRAQSISDLLTQLALDTQKLAQLKGILKDYQQKE